MEYNNVSSKFTLQTQTKYKNIRIPACLQGLFPLDISFHSSVQNTFHQRFYTAKIQTFEK